MKIKKTNNQTTKNKSVVLETENINNNNDDAVIIIEKKAFKISCHRCEYSWFFSGELKTATCPKCRTTVSLTRRYAKILQELRDRKKRDGVC